jgi:hypothetical protein
MQWQAKSSPAKGERRCRCLRLPARRLSQARALSIAFDFVILRSDGPGAELKNAYIPPLEKSGTSSKLPVGSSRLRFIPKALAASSQSLRS